MIAYNWKQPDCPSTENWLREEKLYSRKEGGSFLCPDKELLLRERAELYTKWYVCKRGGGLHLHMRKTFSERRMPIH